MPTQAQPFPRNGWISFILVCAAYVRLTGLATSPGWFSDEGTHLDIANRIVQGKTQYLAVTDSLLLFARLPLFEQLLAFTLRLFPYGMTSLRGLTVGLSLLTVFLLMLPSLGIQAEPPTPRSPPLNLLPALLLALLYDPVLYARFGFSYNLLAPLLLLIYWALVRYRLTEDWRMLALASAATGLALISDLWAVPIAPIAAYVAMRKNMRHLPLAVLLIATPSLIYLTHALLTMPDAFLFDLRYTLTRVSGSSATQQLDTLAGNMQVLARQHGWLLLGGIGLLALPADRRNLAAGLFWIPLLVVGRSVAVHNLSFYYNIPLLPLACLGLIAGFQFLQNLIKQVPSESAQRGLLTALTLFCFVASGRNGLKTVQAVQGEFSAEIGPFLVDAAAAQAAAAVVNRRADSDDLTLASPAIAWQIDGNVADFQHSAASRNLATPHFPDNLPADRFAFDPHHSQAAYIITDPLWTRWADVHVSEVAALLDELTSWPKLYDQNGVIVHCRPTVCK